MNILNENWRDLEDDNPFYLDAVDRTGRPSRTLLNNGTRRHLGISGMLFVCVSCSCVRHNGRKLECKKSYQSRTVTTLYTLHLQEGV